NPKVVQIKRGPVYLALPVKEHPRPVPGELFPVLRGERQGLLPVQVGACRGAEARGEARRAFVGEGDEAAIEGGVPEGGEEEAVVDVEALVVGGAVLPGHDVGGAQEGLVADAGERTAAAPVLEQGRAKEVLAEALNQQA